MNILSRFPCSIRAWISNSWSVWSFHEGISNYAFPIILNTSSILKRNKFEKYLTYHGIEYRRGNAGGGNQLRQPYLKKYRKIINGRKFKNVERVHFFGYYIGNYPYLTKNKLEKLIIILNKFKFKSWLNHNHT